MTPVEPAARIGFGADFAALATAAFWQALTAGGKPLSAWRAAARAPFVEQGFALLFVGQLNAALARTGRCGLRVARHGPHADDRTNFLQAAVSLDGRFCAAGRCLLAGLTRAGCRASFSIRALAHAVNDFQGISFDLSARYDYVS